VLPQTRSPRQDLWKEEHETSPINPGEREISASRRLRGRLGDPPACMKCSNAHTCAKPAGNDMHSRRALIVIIERSTILVRVFTVAPNGVVRTSTEITSRSNILMSTPTWYLARRQVPAARPRSSEENGLLPLNTTDGFRLYPCILH
jgi:hypothetical protein